MTEMVKVTVRLPREVHAEVRARAFREGVSMDGLGRRWFGEYANGGLGAGVSTDADSGAAPVTRRGHAASPAPASSPSFRPDPKKGK